MTAPTPDWAPIVGELRLLAQQALDEGWRAVWGRLAGAADLIDRKLAEHGGGR